MSWIAGGYSKAHKKVIIPQHLLGQNKYIYENNSFTIVAGGNDKTLFSNSHDLTNKQSNHTNTIYFVVGLGFDAELSSGVFNKSDWGLFLSNHDCNIDRLNGHYVIVSIIENNIIFQNDALEYRTMYFFQDHDIIWFATSIFILKQLVTITLDYEQLGGFWLTEFPPTHNTCYKGVFSLGPAGKYSLGEISFSSSIQWYPLKVTTNQNDAFVKLCKVPLINNHVTLGMSGGLDCRVILAALLNCDSLQLISLGDKDHIDLQIAQQIAAHYQLKWTNILYDDLDTLSWEKSIQYIGLAGIGANPANYLYLKYYRDLSMESDIYISGWRGELYRSRRSRKFSIACLGQKPINPIILKNIISINRPDIFQHDPFFNMNLILDKDIEHSYTQMPNPKQFSTFRWLDLFYARYYTRSILLNDLHWIDNYLPDFMPFIYPVMMNYRWNTNIFDLVNESFHRSIIKTYMPSLQNFPLVMADTSTPYYYRGLMMELIKKLRHTKLSQSYMNNSDRYLQYNRDNVFDLLNSNSTRSNSVFHYNNLCKLINDYYNGRYDLRIHVLSWLAIVFSDMI